MNDDELLNQIRSVVPPPPTSSAQERARLRALTAFRHGETGEKETVHPWSWGWVWVGAAAAILLAVALSWRNSLSSPVPNEGALLAEIENVFPGELNAVIERNGQVEVALTEQPGNETDQPLLIEFRRGASLVRVLSYSGRHVCVDLGGKQACFEALLDERGGVIVAGDDYVASPSSGETAHGWNVSAHSLAHSS